MKTGGGFAFDEQFCSDAARSTDLFFAGRNRKASKVRAMGQSDGNAERNARMYELWKDGLALASIAGEFKLPVDTIRLTVGQMDRIAMWRLIGRDAKGKHLAAPPAEHFVD